MPYPEKEMRGPFEQESISKRKRRKPIPSLQALTEVPLPQGERALAVEPGRPQLQQPHPSALGKRFLIIPAKN